MRDLAMNVQAAACSARIRASNAKRRHPALARIGVALALALASTQPAHAIGIVDAYRAALGHDPEYASAVQDKRAGDANVAIGRSYLLPNLSASYGTYRDWTNTDYFGQQYGNPSTAYQMYHSYAASVQLRQPLISLEGIARYRYGKAAALASDAEFDDKSEDLLVRVLTAYTDTVFALDQVALAKAQVKTLEAQLASNEAELKNGQGTRTDVLETNSKLELARADLADARDNLDNTAHALEAVTGLSATLDIGSLDRLDDQFQPVPPSPASFQQWRDIALDSNAALVAQRHAVEAARQQLKVARAGYYPHVDLVASIGRDQSSTLDAIGQRYFQKQVGVEITIPLYSGGMVSASSAQASARFEHAQDDLLGKTNEVLLELRKQYNLCNSGVARIAALERAVASATEQVKATHKSVEAGVRTNVDVLTATQQLYESKRDLAKARYQYMIASLALKHAAGILGEQDLYELSKWFTPVPVTVTDHQIVPQPALVSASQHAAGTVAR